MSHSNKLILPRLTIRQAQNLLTDNIISAVDLCKFCFALATAGEKVWELSAFSSLLSEDTILEQAAQSDERRKRGAILSPVDGIPFSVKANLAVASCQLTAGSRILGAANGVTAYAGNGETNNQPNSAGYTATTVQSLQEGGAVMIGITHMDEFGMGSLGTHLATGSLTKNPLPFLQKELLRDHRQHQQQAKDDEEAKRIILTAMQSSKEDILENHRERKRRLLSSSTSHTNTDKSDNNDDLFYSAGGSSCGSAASIAHGSSLFSVGSDTGGSIRLPAAWCGVTGLKPSYGRLSRHGLVSYASSLDTVGILAHSPDCVAIALKQVLQEQQRKTSSNCQDSTLSGDVEVRTKCGSTRNISYSTYPNLNDDERKNSLSGVTVGIPEAFSVKECSVEVRDVWTKSAEVLQEHGATIEIIPDAVISSTILQHSLAAYYVLSSAEASSNLARYDGFRYGVAPDESSYLNELTRLEKESKFSLLEYQYSAARTLGFGPEVARRILCGTSVLSSDKFHTYYESAAKLRAVLTKQLHTCLMGQERSDDDNDSYCDMLLVPTAIRPPPNLSSKLGVDQSMTSTATFANDVMTVPASLAGLPAVSVPFDLTDGITDNNVELSFRFGMQLIGPRFGEEGILKAAAVLQAS